MVDGLRTEKAQQQQKPPQAGQPAKAEAPERFKSADSSLARNWSK